MQTNNLRAFGHLLLIAIACTPTSIGSTAHNQPQLVTSAAATLLPLPTPTKPARRYQPTWPSLDSRPLPEWYDRAKVGIFVHWGVYAVPAFGSEWFWTNWRTVAAPEYVDFMKRNYPPGFTYQQFAADLRAELFNASEWAQLFAHAGAQYVVLTAKHHDGFALWPSRYSYSWNAVDVGPHRDVVAELATAVRAQTQMRFGLYHSLFEWYNPMYESDRLSGFTSTEFVTTKIDPELRELVERYRPDVLWSDGDWEAPYEYWNSTAFLAWLYSDSAVADSVVTNDRWGKGTLCQHGDFFTCSDRYNPGTLPPYKWENAMTLDRKSWGHRVNAKLDDYLSAQELIAELVVTVSCGGNLLVNVGPNKYGTIEPVFEERLRTMGDWLRLNGEAVYGSRPWLFQNESNVWYTQAGGEDGEQDGNNDANIVYAFVLDYPYDSGMVQIHSILSATTNVTMLGYGKALQFEEVKSNFLVWFPPKEQLDQLGLAYAWTLRFQMGPL